WKTNTLRLREITREGVVAKLVPLVAVVVLVVVFLASGLSRCMRSPDRLDAASDVMPGRIQIALDIPEPYFD
ncbi:MAG: hypothetical protein O3A51_01340, partial [Verrucomicrobia bacterium]|nr:hypothetical protein [Verrucomicrobiota bacterium]